MVTNRALGLKDFVQDKVLEAVRDGNNGEAGYLAVATIATNAIMREISTTRKGSENQSQQMSAAAYLRLIQSMLSAVRSGVSRSRFLGQIFGSLDCRGEIGSRTILLLEGYFDPGGRHLRTIRMPHAIGVRDARADEFRSALRHPDKAGFAGDVLTAKRVIDFELSSVLSGYDGASGVTYRDEFALLRGGDLWVCTIPLAASVEGEPERCLVGLYEVDGEAGIPPGARQEWDILLLMPEIFDLLQHRVQKMQDTVKEDQTVQILSLGPSAITHELGTSLGIMEASLNRIPGMMEKIAGVVGEDNHEVMEILDNLLAIQRQIQQSKMTTESFTNLERRNPRTRTRVLTVIDEIKTVLSRRLAVANTRLVTSIPENLEIETDIRYVTHVLMNVIINAIEAIRPSNLTKEPDGSEIQKIIAVEVVPKGDLVEIAIANNGPEIPVDIKARIFEQGITTKPRGIGHGQGLHLCRQIAAHLGGSFDFGPPPKVLCEANVSFRLTLPSEVTYESDQ